jgi:hypothetical protein
VKGVGAGAGAGLLSASLGCAEDVPGNREDVVEVTGGNEGFGAEEPEMAAAFEGGKDAKGFAVVLGAVVDAEEAAPTPAIGFDFGTLSLSVLSSFDAGGLAVVSLACNEAAGRNDGITIEGGLADDVVDGAGTSEG